MPLRISALFFLILSTITPQIYDFIHKCAKKEELPLVILKIILRQPLHGVDDGTRLHFLLTEKIVVFPASSRREASVPRTLAFYCSSPIP